MAIAAGGIIPPIVFLALWSLATKLWARRTRSPSLSGASTASRPSNESQAAHPAGASKGSDTSSLDLASPATVAAVMEGATGKGGQEEEEEEEEWSRGRVALQRGRPNVRALLASVVAAHADEEEVEVLVGGGWRTVDGGKTEGKA